MRRFYRDRGFDVFIPDYYSKEGIEANVEQVASFIEENHLSEYRELYIFSYILGAWVLNTYLQENELPNLRRIVYDRSPLQEQAAGIVLEKFPSIIDTFYGVTVQEFDEMPYPPFVRGDQPVEIGIIIECRATPLVRRNRDQIEEVTAEGWLPGALNQEHDDFMYVFRHHDEMYYSFDAVGDDILSFFEHGRFTDDAQREPCEDPFRR